MVTFRVGRQILRKSEVSKSSKDPPTPFRGSLVCEVFVLVFATTAGPKPDHCHAFVFSVSPSKVSNSRNHQNIRKLKFVIFCWRAVTPNEQMYTFREYIVGIFDIVFEFVFNGFGVNADAA